MATIIDSLIMTLGLDTRNYDQNRTRVDQGLDQTRRRANEVDRGFRDLTSTATKFLAILGGAAAIRNFIEHTITTNAEVYRLSQNLGLAVEKVTAFGNAIATIGGGAAEGLESTLNTLSRAQTQLQLTGESGLVPYFSALGVSFSDLEGRARPVTDLLLDLSEKFEGMDRTKANNIGLMMGIDQGTLNAMLEGRRQLEAVIKRQQEFNAVTKKQGEESVRLQRSFREVKLEFAAFGRSLLSDATPALEKLLSLFSDLAGWVRANKEFIVNFLTIMGTLLGIIALKAIPINLLATAILALGAAVAALWQDWQVWNRGGDSLFDWGKLKPGVDMLTNALKTLKDVAGDVFYRVSAGFRTIWNDITGNKAEADKAFDQMIKGKPAETKTTATPTAQVKINPNAASVANYFKSKGWTSEQASGIAANLQRESNFKANAVGDSGKAYGVAQWHPDRQAEFKKFAGKDIRDSSLEEQLDFVNYELTKGKEKAAGDRLKKASTYAESASVVSKYYERPRDREKEAGLRSGIASGIYADLQAGYGATKPNKAVASANNSNVETHIGEIHVYTQATDAKGVADGMADSMNYLFASQANTGVF